MRWYLCWKLSWTISFWPTIQYFCALSILWFFEYLGEKSTQKLKKIYSRCVRINLEVNFLFKWECWGSCLFLLCNYSKIWFLYPSQHQIRDSPLQGDTNQRMKEFTSFIVGQHLIHFFSKLMGYIYFIFHNELASKIAPLAPKTVSKNRLFLHTVLKSSKLCWKFAYAQLFSAVWNFLALCAEMTHFRNCIWY